MDWSQFPEQWAIDFEFRQPDGEAVQEVHCLAALELRTGRVLRLWADELASMATPPFTDSCLMIAYYGSAEINCYRRLRWRPPKHLLDLYVEFRNHVNGRWTGGSKLIDALAHFGLPSLDAEEKEEMRALAIRGGPFTSWEQQVLQDYCHTDVVALADLLPKLEPDIHLGRALLRGQYMAASSAMETRGIPINKPLLDQWQRYWDAVEVSIIREVDRHYGVFVPTGRRKVNPVTRFGAAVLDVAKRYRLDAGQLAEVTSSLWTAERDRTREFRDAIKAARSKTGLTLLTIRRWEEDGHDYSTYPGLDVTARELAADYPILGLGYGYVAGELADNRDHAGELWELLSNDVEILPPRHHPDWIDQAAGLLGEDSIDGWDGQRLSFNTAKFAEYLIRHDIPWPRLDSGALDLQSDTFREMAKAYPQLQLLHELRSTLSQMRLNSLTVGQDGRNRCLLSAYRSKTGRNQPSNARYIFGPATWYRGLIRPAPGWALAYIDWSQQEFGIAAALACDENMRTAYLSGDPYLAFAKQVGAVPADATKKSHGAVRDQFKACVLAVQYGMGDKSLAARINGTPFKARQLLQLHREAYPRYWKWAEGAINVGMLLGTIQTVYGWRLHATSETKWRTLANFPCQANGAEMLRLACCLADRRQLPICAPIHDALLVEAPIASIDAVVAATQAVMAEASREVLKGFELRSDAKVIRYPRFYRDDRGKEMWRVVRRAVKRLQRQEAARLAEEEPF